MPAKKTKPPPPRRDRSSLPILQTFSFRDALAEVRLDEDRIRVFIKVHNGKHPWSEQSSMSGTYRNVIDHFVKTLQSPPQPRSLFGAIFGG